MRGITVSIDLVAHEAAHVGDHLRGEAVARIEHGEHDAMDRSVSGSGAAHLIDRRQQLRQAFEREEFALQRHEDASAAVMAFMVRRFSEGGQSIST